MNGQEFVRQVFKAFCRSFGKAFPRKSPPPLEWKDEAREQVKYRFIAPGDGIKIDLTEYHEKENTDWVILTVNINHTDIARISVRGNDSMQTFLDYEYLGKDSVEIFAKLVSGMIL